MKRFNIIREPKETTFTYECKQTLIIAGVALFLGILSKYLDTLSINDKVWWHNILDQIQLNNFLSNLAIWLFLGLCISIYSRTPLSASIKVFVFFLIMNISYHISSIILAGFNPQSYMLQWYMFTLVSPLIAYIVWYAKGKGFGSVIINILIIAVVFRSCFSIGFWYFDTIGILYTITFIGTIICLYDNILKSSLSLFFGLYLAYIISDSFYF